jgi:histidinol-phosphate aminotransferase
MVDLNRLVRYNVKRLVPYSSARDEYQGEEGIFLDANENPYGVLNRYPDPYQRKLKSAISRVREIPEANIFLGNGSDEIIDLCYRTFCNPGSDKALSFVPSYGMYEVSSEINDVELLRIPLGDDFQIDMETVKPFLTDPKLKLIFICSPNNPTGNSMDPAIVESLVAGFGGIVVIDEAYIDFAGQESFKNLTGRYNNLIVMQTFSKAMGMAAVRVGMAFMDSKIVSFFNKMKPPYNISSINQNAVLKSISAIDSIRKKVEVIKAERERVARSLEKISIVEKVYPSDANFLLVKTADADMIYSTLVGRKIIVRNRNKIVPGCIRITIGSVKENNSLLRTMRKIKI